MAPETIGHIFIRTDDKRGRFLCVKRAESFIIGPGFPSLDIAIHDIENIDPGFDVLDDSHEEGG
jgi:hypothetical protein